MHVNQSEFIGISLFFVVLATHERSPQEKSIFNENHHVFKSQVWFYRSQWGHDRFHVDFTWFRDARKNQKNIESISLCGLRSCWEPPDKKNFPADLKVLEQISKNSSCNKTHTKTQISADPVGVTDDQLDQVVAARTHWQLIFTY